VFPGETLPSGNEVVVRKIDQSSDRFLEVLKERRCLRKKEGVRSNGPLPAQKKSAWPGSPSVHARSPPRSCRQTFR